MSRDEVVAYLEQDPDSWALESDHQRWVLRSFSSDRTIREYADEIWHATPCPVA